MRGSLREIDIASLLHLLATAQRSGTVYVEDSAGRAWMVCLHSGLITYALELGLTPLNRLQDFLHAHQPRIAWNSILAKPADAEAMPPEYGYLWELLQGEYLSAQQGQWILQQMVREILFDLLLLQQGCFWFVEEETGLPLLAALEPAPLLASLTIQLQEWKLLAPYISSPEQFLEIRFPQQLRDLLTSKAFKTLESWAENQTGLRRLGRILGRDFLSLAKTIYPYAQQGLVKLVFPDRQTPLIPPPAPHLPLIFFIGNGMSNHAWVKGTLNRQGYEVMEITDALGALSPIFQLKPALIFCDTFMPDLSGYDVCSLLRSTSVFRHTPIVLLATEEQFVERTKARLSGATHYISQPLTEDELLTLVHCFAGCPAHLLKPKSQEFFQQESREIAWSNGSQINNTAGIESYAIAGVSL